MSLFRGERGKVGDHGQDGRPGPEGPRGPAGVTDAQREQDADIRDALALALAEKTRDKDVEVDRHIKRVDRRIYVVAAFVLFSFVLFFFVDERSDERFEDQIIANCNHQNSVLEGLAQAALTNPARDAKSRERAANNLRELQSDCPPS